MDAYEIKQLTCLTHSGTHHMDEVVAVGVLQNAMDLRVWVERVRDDEAIFGADFVLDMGGVYDPAAGRFDHHQGLGDANLPRPDSLRPRGYATAGLVWLEHGRRVIEKEAKQREVLLTPEEITKVFEYVDADYIAPVDNWDNGIHPNYGVIPAQNVISSMKFAHALQTCASMLKTHVIRKIEHVADIREGLETLNTPEGIQVWRFGAHYVVQGKAGQFLPVVTAQQIALDRYGEAALGVISSFRDGSNSVLLLRKGVVINPSYTKRIADMPGISLHASGSMVYAQDPALLLEVAKLIASATGGLSRVAP